MSSSVRGPQGAISLEVYTKKIHSVFDMHRVEFGAPEDLPPFLKRLREDRHLAMDFWALAAAISTSEGGDLPHAQMLEIIVHGVTGKDPAELRQSGDDEMKRALDDLGHLLAGVDLDSPSPEDHGLPVTEKDTWPPDPNKKQPVSVSSRIKAVPPIEKPAEPVFDEPVGKEPVATEDHPINNVDSRAQISLPSEGHVKDGGPLSERALDEVLSQLEMNSRTLRLHLENIDSRMSRIEPHLEELTLKVASSPTDVAQEPSAESQSVSKQTNEAISEERIPDGIKDQNEDRIEDRNQAPVFDSSASPPVRIHRPNRSSNPRLVLLTDDDDDPSIRVPLSGYERASRPRALHLFLALLLVLGGLYAIERMYGTQLRGQYAPRLALAFHQSYDALAQKLHSLTRSSTGSPNGSSDKQETAAVASGDDHNTDPMSSTTSPSEESLHSAPVANTAPAAAAPDAGENESASGSASAPPPAPSPAAPAAAPASGPATPPATATPPAATPAPAPAAAETPRGALLARSLNESRAGRRGSEPTDAGDFTRASGHFNPAEIPVNVPPNVMQENLITSRVPAYPQAAKADGVEGQVVMQTIISKNGTVDQVHVIQGDPLLRTAASEAVSKWHYRPYTVNGRPVDVSTIVKVEFKLPRRY